MKFALHLLLWVAEVGDSGMVNLDQNIPRVWTQNFGPDFGASCLIIRNLSVHGNQGRRVLLGYFSLCTPFS